MSGCCDIITLNVVFSRVKFKRKWWTLDKCQMMVNEGTIMNATNSFDHVDPDYCFLIINRV